MKYLILLIGLSTFAQETRTITYERLTEFSRLLDYSKAQDSIYYQLSKETALKDTLLINRGLVINKYQSEIIPLYESRISKKDSIIKLDGQIFSIKESYYERELKEQKAKKWYWLGGGVLVGIIVGLFGGL